MRAGMDGSEVVTLFVNDRSEGLSLAGKSPLKWRSIRMGTSNIYRWVIFQAATFESRKVYIV